MDVSENLPGIPPGIRTISLDQFIFNPGTTLPSSRHSLEPVSSATRTRARVRQQSQQPQSLIVGPPIYFTPPWATRALVPPAPGMIRLLDPPEKACYFALESLWYKDITLSQWIAKIDDAYRDLSDNPIAVSLRPLDYIEQLETVFYGNQRQRWLAHIVRQRWCNLVWRKKTQCNVDMIDMAPIANKDAIFLTDTKHRQIYRFHRRDIFTNLLTNICMSDEMLPSPRAPTNPWTNTKLTMPQTMSICQQIIADYAKRGQCPPVLFSAFWAARFCLRRFHDENSALLSQHAIQSYFKDLHDDNVMLVFDTVMNLLDTAQINYSTVALRRWLRQTPHTPMHREWLAMARDYTLYINLHIQARRHWYSEDHIYADVRRLYNRTVLPDPASARLQLLRSAAGAAGAAGSNLLLPALPALPAIPAAAAPAPPLYSILTYPLFFNAPRLIQDASGGVMSDEQAIQLIRDALFRF